MEGARTELHDLLGLTGAEVSVNTIPAGGSVPFVHAHKANEEIYFILSGKGKVEIDGQSGTGSGSLRKEEDASSPHPTARSASSASR